MKPSGYVLAMLLGLFIIGVPNAIRLNWGTLGPLYARTAALVVPNASAEGDHVLTRGADVTITSQCSGAENIQIFSMLFATIFLMNWKRMQGWKSVLLYVSALTALALINLGRIVTIVIRAKETHYGLANMVALILMVLLVWKVSWLRPVVYWREYSPSASNK
jgi:exosortase/archaeosortase family protein